VPFASALHLTTHFHKHGHRFGAATENDYEKMAEAFMSQPLHADLYECTRTDGDRIRLEGITHYYGVAYDVTIIRTFHIRDAHGIAMRGGPAGFVAHKCRE